MTSEKNHRRNKQRKRDTEIYVWNIQATKGSVKKNERNIIELINVRKPIKNEFVNE